MYELAWAYDLAGQADSAVAILQRAVTATGSRTVRADAEWRGRALQRLAQLTRVRGDTAAARGYHNALIHLYRDADASVQERMRASL